MQTTLAPRTENFEKDGHQNARTILPGVSDTIHIIESMSSPLPIEPFAVAQWQAQELKTLYRLQAAAKAKGLEDVEKYHRTSLREKESQSATVREQYERELIEWNSKVRKMEAALQSRDCEVQELKNTVRQRDETLLLLRTRLFEAEKALEAAKLEAGSQESIRKTQQEKLSEDYKKWAIEYKTQLQDAFDARLERAKLDHAQQLFSVGVMNQKRR